MFETPCVAFLFDSVHTVNVIVLGVVILIVFGPERLPGIARKLGRMMETFRRAADEIKTQIMAMDQEPKTETDQPSPYDSTPAVDADGVPQSSSGESSAEAYDNPYSDASPYPGNEQHYNVAGQEQATEAEPEAEAEPLASTPAEQPETAEAETKPPESEATS